MVRVCNTCQKEKDICEFGKLKAYKDGISRMCKECNSERGREYNKIFKENKSVSDKKYKESNRDKFKLRRREYRKLKRETDILFRLKENSRSRIRKFIKTKGITINQKSFDMVGCSPSELKEHLEKQFTDGMSWNNYGEWQIDHIIPLSSITTEEEIHKLSHYTNLQPLWAEDNRSKSDTIISPTPKDIVGKCQSLIREYVNG